MSNGKRAYAQGVRVDGRVVITPENTSKWCLTPFFYCRALKNGGSPETIRWLTDRKEDRDYFLNKFGKYGDGKLSDEEMLKDMARDKTANEKGLNCPADVPCEKQCLPLLDGLPKNRKPFMQKYYENAK